MTAKKILNKIFYWFFNSLFGRLNLLKLKTKNRKIHTNILVSFLLMEFHTKSQLKDYLLNFQSDPNTI